MKTAEDRISTLKQRNLGLGKTHRIGNDGKTTKATIEQQEAQIVRSLILTILPVRDAMYKDEALAKAKAHGT